MDLRRRGASDSDIVRALQEQGFSPLQINDALGRAQIKNAVSSITGIEQGMEHSILSSEEEPERLPLEGLEGGTLSDIELTPPSPGGFVPIPRNVTKEISNGNGGMYNQHDQQENMAYYQPQQYRQYAQYQNMPQETYQYSPMSGAQAIDTDTMIEVSEQVFMEKNKPLQKKIDDVEEFRAIAQTKLDHISERLRKIESIIDNLQAAILEKVGGYGHGLETMKKEMNMMQDSFGKIVGDMAKKSEEKHHHIPHPQHHVIVHRSKRTTTRKHSRKK
ncbi:MAG: hypothetical protein AABX79_02895 [Nanoarchaeota archaeon]